MGSGIAIRHRHIHRQQRLAWRQPEIPCDVDEMRTRITASTSRLLLILNGYSGRNELNEATEMAKSLLEVHAKATGLTVCFIDN